MAISLFCIIIPQFLNIILYSMRKSNYKSKKYICTILMSLYCQIQTVNEQKANVQVDYDRLAEFLNRVTPGILEALDEAYGTNAFDDYDPNVAEVSSANVKLLKKINTSRGSDDQVCVFKRRLSKLIAVSTI